MTETPQQTHEQALEVFVEQNYARLLDYFRRRAPPSDARELVQDCMEVLVKKRDTVEVERFERFLFTVASNKIKQYYEARAKRAGIVGFLWSSREMVPMQVMSTRLSIRVARHNDLERAMQKLTGRQFDVIELRWLQGLGISEAAEVLGISEATVKRDTTKAREVLAAELGEETTREIVDAYTKDPG